MRAGIFSEFSSTIYKIISVCVRMDQEYESEYLYDLMLRYKKGCPSQHLKNLSGFY